MEDVQLHLMVPFANLYIGDGSPIQHGLGNVEASVKYRFLHETKPLPEAAIFPTVELPSGNAERGLGNGQAWWIFPGWLHKSWEDWTTYGGGGRAFNHAPGMRSYNFGGWLVQCKVAEHLTPHSRPLPVQPSSVLKVRLPSF